MSSVPCFLIVDAGVCHRYLRRYASGPCSSHAGVGSYHDAAVFLDRVPTPRTADGYVDGTQRWPEDDERWPTHCACGYAFAATDARDLYLLDLYRPSNGVGEYSIHPNQYPGTAKAPAGAMWDAHWMHKKGPDGSSLCVILPDGATWPIDGPSSNGPGWTREGEAPRITVRPSILTPGYHGFLTNGVLESC